MALIRRWGALRIVVLPLVVLWAAFNLGLLVWVVLASFRNGGQIFTRPFDLPTTVDFGNYVDAWSTSQLGAGLLNSLVLVTAGAVTTVGLAAPASYVLARSGARTASPVTSMFAVGVGIPVQVVIVPLWVVMHEISTFMYRTLGWWDDRISLYLLYVATSLPFAVFLLTGFFRTLPADLEEAGALDGASSWQVFRRIMLPLAAPGLVTAMLMTTLALWNETLLALVFITDNEKYTLPQALLGLYGTMQYTSNWGGVFAGIVLIVLPMVLVYSVMGRRIVEGMTLGAGK